MADLQVYNYSGQPLDVESGGISYSMPVGAHRLEIDAASVTITRADTSNFSVSLDTGRTDVTVSTTGHNVVQAETFYSNYAEGYGPRHSDPLCGYGAEDAQATRIPLTGHIKGGT